MRRSLLMCVVLAGCSHGHGPQGSSEDGPSRSEIRARITNDVRRNRLEERLAEGKATCDAVQWVESRATCARDGAAMEVVTLRRDETAYYCPEETLYWYHGAGSWLGPFKTGLSRR